MLFDWSFALEILPDLLRAARTTLLVTAASFAVAIFGGMGVLWLAGCRFRPAAWLVVALSDLIRATPLLIQVFFLFFILPTVGINLEPITTGIVAIGLHYSCYMAEVYRAGLMAVRTGQWQAASALGLSPFATLRYVVIPQMLPVVVPTAGSYLVYMFKDTPILAAITVRELMQVASRIGAENFRYLEPITLVGLLFLAMSLLASFLVGRVEKRISLPAGS
jgi:polar amino acid transport system permease protein